MDYKIEFNTDNAAFHEVDGADQIEAARILRRLADNIEGMGLCEYSLRDFNGNKVGEAGEV